MNRKRTAILLFCAAIFCVCFPFLIEFLYDIGENHPIIITNYEQSDILSYATTSIGLIISLIALYISVDAYIPNFSVRHAISENEEGIAVFIELYNNSPHDYEIQGFELCDKRKRMSHVSISNCAPFILKSKSCKAFFISVDRMKRYIKSVSKTNNAADTEYAIILSIGKSVYIKTGELSHYLELGEGMK